MERKFRLLFVVACTSILVLYLTGCASKKDTPEEKFTTLEDTISVVTAKVEQIQLTLNKIYTGSLEGEQQANVVSQLAERIVEIPFSVGSYVKAGEVVVKLDKGGVTSQYYQALSGLKNVEKDLARMKSLFESGAVSQQVLDGIQTQYDITKANFEAARRAVEITAPISGVVTAKKFEIGDFTAPGIPILTIANARSLKAILSIGEADMPFIKKGQNVKIFSELNPSISANGKVSEISNLADATTRTFEIRAIFPNTGSWFKPGMFVNAELELTTPDKVSVVPRESVIHSESGSTLFIIKDGKAYSRKVKLGIQNENQIVVTEGIQPDEIVAKVGMNNLKDGSPVLVTDDTHLVSSK